MNKKIINIFKKNPNEFYKLLKTSDINNLDSKTISAILTIAFEKNQNVDFINDIKNIEMKEEIFFDLITNNEEKALDLLSENELINFFNKKDIFKDTNLIKVLNMSSVEVGNVILDKLEKNKNKLNFDKNLENETILHVCIKKNIKNISKYFDVMSKEIFEQVDKKNSSAIYYINNVDLDFFEVLCKKYSEYNINLEDLNIKKKNFLNYIIYKDSDLEYIKVLHKYYPEYKINDSAINTTFYEGKEKLSTYLVEYYDLLKNIPKDQDSLNLLWLACRNYKTHKKLFNYVLDNINKDDYIDIFNKKNIHENEALENESIKIETLGFLDVFEESKDNNNNNNKRNYTELMAEYGDIEGLEKLKKKGIFLVDNINSIYENACNDKQLKDIKIQYFNQYIALPRLDENNLFVKQSFKYFKRLNKSMILSYLMNLSKIDSVNILNEFIKKYDLKVNNIEQTYIMLHSIKTSNKELFEDCLKKQTIEEFLTNCEKIIGENDNFDKKNLLEQINDLNIGFIEKYKKEVFCIFDKILFDNKKNSFENELFANILLKTEIFEEFYNYTKDKNELINITKSGIKRKKDKFKVVKGLEKINKEISLKILDHNLGDYYNEDLTILFKNIDLSKISKSVNNNILYSVINVLSNKKITNKENLYYNINYLFENKYHINDLSVISDTKMSKNIFELFLNNAKNIEININNIENINNIKTIYQHMDIYIKKLKSINPEYDEKELCSKLIKLINTNFEYSYISSKIKNKYIDFLIENNKNYFSEEQLNTIYYYAISNLNKNYKKIEEQYICVDKSKKEFYLNNLETTDLVNNSYTKGKINQAITKIREVFNLSKDDTVDYIINSINNAIQTKKNYISATVLNNIVLNNDLNLVEKMSNKPSIVNLYLLDNLDKIIIKLNENQLSNEILFNDINQLLKKLQEENIKKIENFKSNNKKTKDDETVVEVVVDLMNNENISKLITEKIKLVMINKLKDNEFLKQLINDLNYTVNDNSSIFKNKKEDLNIVLNKVNLNNILNGENLNTNKKINKL